MYWSADDTLVHMAATFSLFASSFLLLIIRSSRVRLSVVLRFFILKMTKLIILVHAISYLSDIVQSVEDSQHLIRLRHIESL